MSFQICFRWTYLYMIVMHFIICVLVFISSSVMYFNASDVLFCYLLYAPVYPVPMRCLSMFSYVQYFQFFSVLIMQKSDTVYAYNWTGLRLFIYLFTVCACFSSTNALPFYVQLCTIFSVLLCIDYAKIYILVYAYSFSFFVWRQYIHIDFSSPALWFFQHKYCMRCSEYMII